MAEKKNNNKSNLTGILSKLTFAPQNRTEPLTQMPAGRFRMFSAFYKRNSEVMMSSNLCFMLFALPLLAVVFFVATMGAERLSYIINGLELPNFMYNFGFGLSSGMPIIEGQAQMLVTYRLLFLGIGVAFPFLGFGASGMYHVTSKIVFFEKFVSKKDSYGNDVPRAFKEFFVGVKKYWKQFVPVFLVVGLVIAGAANLIINFVEGVYLKNNNAFDYIFLIISILVTLFTLLVFTHLLPIIVGYEGKLSFFEKLKNAIILTIALFVPSLLITLLVFAPIVLLMTNMSGFIGMILMVGLVTFGASLYCLLLTNFQDYNAEKIMTPVYNSMNNSSNKAKKKDKTNKVNKNKR